jgi:transcriptional regulator with XRE-family HTH domain
MSSDSHSKKYLKRLGLRLREIRNQKGWTLEETEEHGWQSWRHLQKIESGKNITVETLFRLSKLYKMEAWEIIKGV